MRSAKVMRALEAAVLREALIETMIVSPDLYCRLCKKTCARRKAHCGYPVTKAQLSRCPCPPIVNEHCIKVGTVLKRTIEDGSPWRKACARLYLAHEQVGDKAWLRWYHRAVEARRKQRQAGRAARTEVGDAR